MIDTGRLVAGCAGERQQRGDQPLRGGRGGAGSSYRRRSDISVRWPALPEGRGHWQAPSLAGADEGAR